MISKDCYPSSSNTNSSQIKKLLRNFEPSNSVSLRNSEPSPPTSVSYKKKECMREIIIKHEGTLSWVPYFGQNLESRNSCHEKIQVVYTYRPVQETEVSGCNPQKF